LTPKTSPVPTSEKSQPVKRLIRLISPRYPALNIYSHIAMPPLGLLYVGTAAVETGRYDVEIIDENNWNSDDHVALQKERPADVVGLYTGLTSTMPRVYELAKIYKDMGAFTVAGGGHAEALPEEAITNGIDVVVRGEGEKAFVELLDAHFSGEDFSSIKGLAYIDADGRVVLTVRREPVMDLGGLPDPDFSLVVDMRRRFKFMPICRTRGCNYRCEFCSVNQRFGSARFAPPEKTLAHFDELIGQGHHFFFVVDDNFAQDREGTLKLCTGLYELQKKHNARLGLTIQARSEIARDPRLMEAMGNAGVKVICIGIESPIEEELRTMHKGLRVADMEADLRALRRNGFLIHGMFIFGYPAKLGSSIGHGLNMRERADTYIEFIRRARIDTLQVLKAVPVPGSPLAERLKNEGRIYPLDEVGWDKYDGNFLCYQPDPGDNAIELQEEATRIMREFYSPWNMLKLLYLGPFSLFDWAFYFVRRGAQRLSVKCREFEELYRRPFPAARKWAAFFTHGLSGAGNEIYRLWRNTIIRIAGSIVLHKWTQKVNIEAFMQKLKRQQERIINALPEYKVMREGKQSQG
jgi:radical SAM superfamily enzyme YgiQ (UPF0313 family)